MIDMTATPEEVISRIYKHDKTMSEADAFVIIEALERQIPKKPDYEGDGYADGELVYDTLICPYCEERYEADYVDYNYCPKCGQRFDLSTEENEDDRA